MRPVQLLYHEQKPDLKLCSLGHAGMCMAAPTRGLQTALPRSSLPTPQAASTPLIQHSAIPQLMAELWHEQNLLGHTRGGCWEESYYRQNLVPGLVASASD